MYDLERRQEINEETQWEHFHDELDKTIDTSFELILEDVDTIYEMYENNLITEEDMYKPFQEFFGKNGIHHNKAKELLLEWVKVTPAKEVINLGISTKKDIVFKFNNLTELL